MSTAPAAKAVSMSLPELKGFRSTSAPIGSATPSSGVWSACPTFETRMLEISCFSASAVMPIAFRWRPRARTPSPSLVPPMVIRPTGWMRSLPPLAPGETFEDLPAAADQVGTDRKRAMSMDRTCAKPGTAGGKDLPF